MRRVLIVADIHGNIDALLALDAEWRRTGRRPDQIVVLGDLVDYGVQKSTCSRTLLTKTGPRSRLYPGLTMYWPSTEPNSPRQRCAV